MHEVNAGSAAVSGHKAMSEAVRLAVMRCAARRNAERKMKIEAAAQEKQPKPKVSKIKPSPVVSQFLLVWFM